MSSRSPSFVRISIALLELMALAAASGCIGNSREGLLSQIPEATMSEAELDAWNLDLADEFIALVEAAGNQILLESPEPQDRRFALLWMIRTNEEVLKTVRHADPVAALADLWAFSMQMELLFSEGEGSEVFTGENQVLALEVSRELVAKLDDLVAQLVGGRDKMEGRLTVMEFARDNPIKVDRLRRPAVTPLLASWYDNRGAGMLDAVDSLDEGVTDIGNRLDVMGRQLPKQFVWYATLVIDDRLQEMRQSGALERVDRVEQRLVQFPDEIDQIVNQALDRIEQQRIDTFESFNSQRLETLDQIQSVAETSLEVLSQERADVIVQLETIVERTIEAVDEESDESLDEIRLMVEDLTRNAQSVQATVITDLGALRAQSFADGQALATASINKIFQAGLKLVGAACVGAGLLIGLYARLTRPRRA